MDSKIGFASRLGVALVLLGGAGFAAGSVMLAQYDCVSGTALGIEKVAEPNSTAVTGNTTEFLELSPVEQRIFLEAYTDSSDNWRHGETYANWSGEWFDSGRSYRPGYVEYRDEYWELLLHASDCGGSAGVFVRIGGVLCSIIGGVVLTVSGLWRLWQTL